MKEYVEVKIHALGRDSWVHFSYGYLTNFTLRASALTLTSSKIFKSSFLKNEIVKFLSKALIVFILTYSSNGNHFHNQSMISTKIVITNFRELLRKL